MNFLKISFAYGNPRLVIDVVSVRYTTLFRYLRDFQIFKKRIFKTDRKINKKMKIITKSNKYAHSISWIFAIAFAVAEAHFFISGYRLTGDDVLFEYVLLQNNAASYILHTAIQQGRVGDFFLIPFLLVGSHFSNYLWFRLFYVLLWYVDILLFSIWTARIARLGAALPIFLSIVSLQAMIGYHMPPVGYPLMLGLPAFIIFGIRLLIQAGWKTSRSQKSSSIFLRCSLMAVYSLAVLSSEYMMILGLLVIMCEMAESLNFTKASLLDKLKNYKYDVLVLVLVYSIYLVFRLSFPTQYDGIGLDGLSNIGAALYTFFMHIADGTWIPFFRLSMITADTLSSAIPVMVMCFLALMLYWRHGSLTSTSSVDRKLFPGVIFLIGVIAITVPVVAASKQQKTCLIDHNCSYLDSRISLLLLIASITIIGSYFCQSKITRGYCRIFILLFLTIGSGVGYIVNIEQAKGMETATMAWERARAIACVTPRVDKSVAASFIDPDHYIPMHSFVNRSEFWSEYMDRLAKEGDCTSQPPLKPPFYISELSTGTEAAVDLGGVGLKFLGSGWSHAEQGGVWSDGADSLLEAKIAPSTRKLKMILTLQGFASIAGKPQSVVLTVNDLPTANWIVKEEASSTYEFFVPTALAAKGGEITVRIKIEHPTSPAEKHQSSDSRKLGIFLSKLQLQEQ
jgi:hypothetical protein